MSVREISVKVSLTLQEKEILENGAKIRGELLAPYIRRCALEKAESIKRGDFNA